MLGNHVALDRPAGRLPLRDAMAVARESRVTYRCPVLLGLRARGALVSHMDRLEELAERRAVVARLGKRNA
jgi:hypothetical protein